MKGLGLLEESAEETIPTVEVRGLISDVTLECVAETPGVIFIPGGINSAGVDGVTDWQIGDYALVHNIECFIVGDDFAPAGSRDGIYLVEDLGEGFEGQAELTRVGTTTSLFEVLEGNKYGGTFWKNLTPVTYVLDVTPFIFEQLEIETL